MAKLAVVVGLGDVEIDRLDIDDAGIGVDDDGKELPPNTLGNLVVKPGWPGMMKTIWQQPERYESYFRIPGWYVTGDSAYKDPDGYFWFQGRVDDLIITAGENVGPFEVESCLVEHPAVAEAGVIGKPDAMRGDGGISGIANGADLGDVFVGDFVAKTHTELAHAVIH